MPSSNLLTLLGVSFASVLCMSILSTAPVSVDGAYCHGSPKPDAQPNLHPISQPDPLLITTTKNGALYQVVIDDLDVPLVHVWGTPYEKGYAQGTLLSKRLHTCTKAYYQYILESMAGPLNETGLPWSVIEQIEGAALNISLDIVTAKTKPYSGEWYDEELRGMADASGVDHDLLRRFQMFGELTGGSCSMFGAWDDALAGGHGLLTMRALDWIVEPGSPFKDCPLMTVYHADDNPTKSTPPLSKPEQTFISIGFIGWVGSITGVSANQLSIHEIGVSYPDESFGERNTYGIPFNYVLRDILQFDTNRLDGLSRLASSRRTTNLILGVGDGKDRRFNSVAYSETQCGIMDDTNMRPVADWHPAIPSTVYHAMDWLCPSFNSVMAAQLKARWGNLTAANAISDILPIVQTGDLHSYVADLTDMQLFVSFHAPSDSQSKYQQAYDRQWAQFDLKTLFDTPKPTNQTAWV